MNAAVADITSNLFYNCGFKYNVEGGDATYYEVKWHWPFSSPNDVFYLSEYILKKKSEVVNCSDQAHAVFALGNLLGAGTRVKRLEPFGYLKRNQLVGWETYVFEEACFMRHYFTMNGQWVFDSCVGPVLGNVGVSEYVGMIVESDKPTPSSRSGTVADVSDFGDVGVIK